MNRLSKIGLPIAAALAAIVAFMVGPESTPPEAQAGGKYPMLCRGPLRIKLAGMVDIFPKKNTTAAGADGSGLQPGMCAWKDRPLNSQEPSRITFAYASDSGWRPNMPEARRVLTICSLDVNCIIEFWPNENKVGRWLVLDESSGLSVWRRGYY